MDFNLFRRLIPYLENYRPGPPGATEERILPYRQVLFRLYPRQTYRPAAVLVLFYPTEGRMHTVLIERPLYDGIHSGQIAFPGGKKEPQDPDLYHTALREASEEVGLNPEPIRRLAALRPVKIPVSGFEVTPFMAYTHIRPRFRPDPSEVHSLLELPLEDLLFTPWQITEKVYDGRTYPVYYLPAGPHRIWGATAMVIAELRDVFARAARAAGLSLRR
ncbi:MAG: CoA pyrophosphatase [Chlorobi bacterium]|nr:CoA pyrophosphatase [Chlorobiota bacterium]